MPWRSRTLRRGIVSAVVLATISGCGWTRDEGHAGISIKGSDTMIHLVSAWADAYMRQSPQAAVTATGGGSGTGFAALLNGTTDICISSRPITGEELREAAERGIHPVEIPVALDGIAVILHADNPVHELALEELRGIYTGRITNWHEVGGNNSENHDRRIVALSRESSSGTYLFFQDRVMNRANYAGSIRLMTATSAMMHSISTDAGAIGYVGLGYTEQTGTSIRTAAIRRDARSAAVLPTEETVISGEYPIVRTLRFYTDDEPAGTVRDFIGFCRSPAGQQIVRRAGYVPVPVNTGFPVSP